ncbi:hypothetical protein ACQEVG_36295 [Streptomyces sp. CA-135486]|uniref:hypothetical protein n=1 Tax=Streptomyces sp. CA-135486 TaxID=3240049 RepID=UPI003D8E3DE2
MTYSNSEVGPEDAAAIDAYEEALREFTMELNRLHIAYGAPSYATMAKASVRPKLTKAGLNEALAGKRLLSLEALLEFVRVVSNPQPPLPETPAASRARPELVDQWRDRWQHVKFLQRQAHAPWIRVRATAQDVLDQALGEAEDLRSAAHEEAVRICADAEAEAERLRTQAQHDADQLLQDAQAEAEQLHVQAQQDAEELHTSARAATARALRWGAGLLSPRQAWRPLVAVVGVAGVGLAVTLAADSLTGQLSSSCRPTHAHPAAPVAPEASLQPGGTVEQVAVAHEPQMIIFSPWAHPTWSPWSPATSATPSEDPSPTPSSSPRPSALPTPTASATHAPAGACGRTGPSASPTRSPASSAS